MSVREKVVLNEKGQILLSSKKVAKLRLSTFLAKESFLLDYRYIPALHDKSPPLFGQVGSKLARSKGGGIVLCLIWTNLHCSFLCFPSLAELLCFHRNCYFFASIPGSNFVENHHLWHKLKKGKVTLTEPTADGFLSRMVTGCL